MYIVYNVPVALDIVQCRYSTNIQSSCTKLLCALSVHMQCRYHIISSAYVTYISTMYVYMCAVHCSWLVPGIPSDQTHNIYVYFDT